MAVTTRLMLFACVLALPACGASGTSSELVDARRAYLQAERSKAAALAPAELLEARQALERAEAAHADDPGSAREKNLAYIADREALEAISRAEIVAAKRTIAGAERRYRELSERLQQRAREQLERARRDLARTSQELSSVRTQLADQSARLGESEAVLREREKQLAERKAELEAKTAELDTEREAHLRAERQAAVAIASLQEIANVQEQQRGTVISLSGSLLFASGKSELLPIARQKLAAVADALQLVSSERTILVEGHTDSRGSDEMNLSLSQNRADAVRSFLVSQAVDPNRIRAVGRGEHEPIADNSTPEGRAENRRVEIVIENPSPSPAR